MPIDPYAVLNALVRAEVMRALNERPRQRKNDRLDDDGAADDTGEADAPDPDRP
ncbi:hypothetical protein LRS74_17115 [Streptomyces sp. LX-29]|uniref:hypothetical protein n=1 Tax=unclassified Streptomyces TaxID=2593676 RepID=UPI001642D644|nr:MULTISPECIES: hypothetical protein [unclassified Streptomyces]WFB08575.1 hypothetical protein LRS74_17115 [Streptomyces sp. LX-29]